MNYVFLTYMPLNIRYKELFSNFTIMDMYSGGGVLDEFEYLYQTSTFKYNILHLLILCILIDYFRLKINVVTNF